MEVEIITIIATIAFSIVLILFLWKKFETLFEKALFIFLVCLEVIIFVLYYCDSNNIPSMLGWSENVNPQNWLSILSTTGTGIVIEFISGLILVTVTKLQINSTQKENQERDKEDRRISNLPILKYNFEDNNEKIILNKYLKTNIENGMLEDLYFNIKNVGMNSVRKCYISIESDIFPKNYNFEISSQNIIEKGEEIKINLIINLIPGQYILNFFVYFQDLMFNWYSQNIVMDYEVFTILDSNSRNICKYNFVVYDEKLLERLPEIEFELS